MNLASGTFLYRHCPRSHRRPPPADAWTPHPSIRCSPRAKGAVPLNELIGDCRLDPELRQYRTQAFLSLARLVRAAGRFVHLGALDKVPLVPFKLIFFWETTESLRSRCSGTADTHSERASLEQLTTRLVWWSEAVADGSAKG